MLLPEKIALGILIAVYIGLAIINTYLEPLNRRFRMLIEHSRSMKLRPLMILTHKYNDVVSLSMQVLLLSLFIGLFWNDWRRAMVLTSAMFVQTTAVTATKQLAAVNRPPQDHSHVIMKTGSYPSGHTAASMTFALLAPMVLQPYLPPIVLGILAIYLMSVALLTAYGRLFLDVHWLSDIVGAWLVSAMTFVLGRIFLA
ncbi:MAG: phosphatase PAP2 family protein [Eubacteriales bacterium]|nr:phosphatase PAP2 family protein [Eubacteriales bacterium]